MATRSSSPPKASEDHFGCPRCWPAEAKDAWAAVGSLEEGPVLESDSHLHVDIRSCAGCGQRFVFVFLEHVDWEDGDDSQYWTLMPITAQEADELKREADRDIVAALNRLGPDRKCLQRDWPKGASRIEIAWARGMFVMM